MSQIYDINSSINLSSKAFSSTEFFYYIPGDIINISTGAVINHFTKISLYTTSQTTPGHWTCPSIGSMIGPTTTTYYHMKIYTTSGSALSWSSSNRAAMNGTKTRIQVSDTYDNYLNTNLGAALTAINTLTTIDLTQYNFAPGQYTLSVISKATDFQDSSRSNSVTYNVYETLSTPTASINIDTLTVSSVTNADAFEVYADNSLKAMQLYTTGNTFDLTTLRSQLLPAQYAISVKAVNTTNQYYLASNAANAGNWNSGGDLAAPSISITNDTLSIIDNSDAENAESFDIYVDGIYATNVAKAINYEVNFNITQYSESYKEVLKLYDGQDNTAPLLYDWLNTSGTIVQTVNCTSGYLFLEIEGSAVMVSLHSTTPDIIDESVIGGQLFTVKGNGSIEGNIEFDD